MQYTRPVSERRLPAANDRNAGVPTAFRGHNRTDAEEIQKLHLLLKLYDRTATKVAALARWSIEDPNSLPDLPSGRCFVVNEDIVDHGRLGVHGSRGRWLLVSGVPFVRCVPR